VKIAGQVLGERPPIESRDGRERNEDDPERCMGEPLAAP